MALTLNQVLFLIITFAIVVAVVFLVRLFIQLRRTAAEGEQTLAEVRVLAKNLSELDSVIKEKVEDLGTTLEALKSAAGNVSKATLPIGSAFGGSPSSYLPLLVPLVRFVWRRLKKRKEKRYGK
jgi:hypothetical protein